MKGEERREKKKRVMGLVSISLSLIAGCKRRRGKTGRPRIKKRHACRIESKNSGHKRKP